MHARHHLFVPGPPTIIEGVLRAMHRSVEAHRSRVFASVMVGGTITGARVVAARRRSWAAS